MNFKILKCLAKDGIEANLNTVKKIKLLPKLALAAGLILAPLMISNNSYAGECRNFAASSIQNLCDAKIGHEHQLLLEGAIHSSAGHSPFQLYDEDKERFLSAFNLYELAFDEVESMRLRVYILKTEKQGDDKYKFIAVFETFDHENGVKKPFEVNGEIVLNPETQKPLYRYNQNAKVELIGDIRNENDYRNLYNLIMMSEFTQFIKNRSDMTRKYGNMSLEQRLQDPFYKEFMNFNRNRILSILNSYPAWNLDWKRIDVVSPYSTNYGGDLITPRTPEELMIMKRTDTKPGSHIVSRNDRGEQINGSSRQPKNTLSGNRISWNGDHEKNNQNQKRIFENRHNSEKEIIWNEEPSDLYKR